MAKLTSQTLPQLEAQAARFKQARATRFLELTEDYVELVADLIEAYGAARQVDMAARLGVAQPTVAKRLKRLAEQGYITMKPRRSVFLTDAGRRLAERARQKHSIVEDLLISLGVSTATARQDAERIEHCVSSETLRAFKKHLLATLDSNEGSQEEVSSSLPQSLNGLRVRSFHRR